MPTMLGIARELTLMSLTLAGPVVVRSSESLSHGEGRHFKLLGANYLTE